MKTTIFLFITLFLTLFCFINYCKADIRNNRFSNDIKRYIGFSFDYDHDYNSNQTSYNFHYRRLSPKWLSEFYLEHKVENTNTSNLPLREKKNYYDLEISNKFIINNINNFYLSSLIIYNYDDFIDYYELNYLAGPGLILYSGQKKKHHITLDLNLGEKREENAGSSFVFNPYLTLNIQLTPKISIRQKAYIIISKHEKFLHNNEHEEYIETNINFRISDNISLRLTNKYKKDFYLYITKTINEYRERLSRSILIGIRYNF